MTLTTLRDLNELAGSGVLLACLKIELAGQSTIYLVNNSENITFNGNEYIAFPFELGELSTAKGEVPQFSLKIDNTTRAINGIMLAYNDYIKTNGIDGNKVIATVYVVNTIDLSEEIIATKFELVSWDITSQIATFKYGASNPFTKEYPPRKLYSDFCGFKFKDSNCKYSGSATTCDKTLARCRALSNSINFGGFKGLNA